MIDNNIVRRILAWIELFVATPCSLFGGYVLINSLRNPESDVHGWGLLAGIFFLTSGFVLVLGALGLLLLKRRHWILHLPFLIWVSFIALVIGNAWID